jgi:Flp pilus assembly protein TadG
LHNLRRTFLGRWRLPGSDAGSAMIEFAVALPIFLYMFFGIVDVGRGIAFGSYVQGMARAATEYGAQNLMDAADISAAGTIVNAAKIDQNNLPAGYTVTVHDLCSVGGAQPPTPCTFSLVSPPVNTVYYLQVVVSANYATILSYPGLPKNIPVSGQAYMQVANQ